MVKIRRFRNPISYRLILNLAIVALILGLAVLLLYQGLDARKRPNEAPLSAGSAHTAPSFEAVETDLLNPLELKTILDASSNELRIVDLRSRERFRKAHLVSAINIPGDELETRAANEISRSARIVLVDCACDGTKQESFIRRSALINSGFKEVLILAGEIEDWRRSGLEVVTAP